jgi:hypothetical protein
MPKQQTQQKQSASQANGTNTASTRKRASPRQTVPVKDRLRVIISAPAVAHIVDDTSTRPWLFNPIFLFVVLALLALAAIEIFVFTQL